MVRERYRLEIYSELNKKYLFMFPFEGSKMYCLGAFHMYDAFYGNKNPTEPMRMIRVSDGAVIEEGGQRKVSLQ
jgi:hypothetical protein